MGAITTRAALIFVLILILGSRPLSVALASSNPQLSQAINAGTLSVDVVDGSGNPVASPAVTFGAVSFSFGQQSASGTLGTSSQKIRLSNGRSSPSVAWTVALAASAPSALWTSGSDTYDFNDASAANGTMTVDASVGTITPTNSYASAGLSLGSSNTFLQGTRDSITILSATTGASQPGRWDLAGVSLSNTIPATQVPGTYTLTMTLTAS